MTQSAPVWEAISAKFFDSNGWSLKAIDLFLIDKHHFLLQLGLDQVFKTLRHHQRRGVLGRHSIDGCDQGDTFFDDIVFGFDVGIMGQDHNGAEQIGATARRDQGSAQRQDRKRSKYPTPRLLESGLLNRGF